MVVAACLLGLAVVSSTTVAWFDALMASALQTHALDPVFEAGLVITTLGGTDIALPASFAAVAVLVALRLWHAGLALLAAVGLTQAVVELSKLLVERPRPAANAAGTEAGGFSFPSGHSATTAALFGVLAIVAVRHGGGGARHVTAGVGIAVILSVGLSRVVLGAHYPADVLAGWLTGGALALGCVAGFTRARQAVVARLART